MFKSEHYGLYFSQQAFNSVTRERNREPYKSAFTKLENLTLKNLTLKNPVETAIVNAFRYRFNKDHDAAQQVVDALQIGYGLGINKDLAYVEKCALIMSAGQAFEMLRDFEGLSVEIQQGWLKIYDGQVQDILNTNDDIPLLDMIWQTALQITAGVILEWRDLFNEGVRNFQDIVKNEIHPEGYFPKLVERSDGGALERQLIGAKGLSLAAEAAKQVDNNLWTFEERGISVRTAAIYAVAYYEYREKWLWDTPPTEDEALILYQTHGGFIEMLNRELRPAVLKTTLENLRPIFDATGGGLTTLSHAQPQKRSLLGF